MAEITEEQITQAVNDIKGAFADGFQMKDIATVLKAATRFAQVASMSGSEKKALSLRVIKRVLDETDTPWLPDSWSDQWMLDMAPGLIDWAVEAAQGKLDFVFGDGGEEG